MKDWFNSWEHVILVLGGLVITLLAGIFVPGPTWEKLGSTVSMIVSNPAASIGAASTVATIIAIIRAAWKRDPNAAAARTPATTTEGNQP